MIMVAGKHTNMKFKIWGVPIEDEIRDGKLYWHLGIENPFTLEDHRYRYGVNEKIISDSQNAGVSYYIIHGKEIRVPSKKEVKRKIKEREYEDKKSNFSGTFKLYHFVC